MTGPSQREAELLSALGVVSVSRQKAGFIGHHEVIAVGHQDRETHISTVRIAVVSMKQTMSWLEDADLDEVACRHAWTV